MEEIKKFEYEGNKITFLTGNNTMVNATEMAKKFEIKPTFWLRTDSAIKMIEAFSKLHNCNFDDLVQVKAGAPETGGGTWMHEDIALVFAQWLSPEFYIWCNDRIKELFKYGITAAQQKDREVIFTLAETTTILKNNSECKIGRYKIYEELRQRGILDEYNKPFPEYVNKGYFKLIPYDNSNNKYTKHVVTTEKGSLWLNQTLYQVQQHGDNNISLLITICEGQKVIMDFMLSNQIDHANLPPAKKSALDNLINVSKKINDVINQFNNNKKSLENL